MKAVRADKDWVNFEEINAAALAASPELLGVRVHSHSAYSVLPPKTTCAINTLRKIRRRHSERFLEPALGAMVTAWPSEKNAFTTAMIAAGERVLRTNADISARQLAKALAIDVPPRLINAGRLYAVDHDIRISPAISRVIIGRVHQARTRKAA